MLAILSAWAAPPTVPWLTGREGGTFRVAIVGELPADAGALAAAVAEEDPSFLVFTSVSRVEDLDAFGPSADRPVIAMPAGAPRRSWLKRFDGIGVPGLPKPVPYGAVDLVSQGTRWRVLYATSWTVPAGPWEEQSFWLPKVLDRSAYDRLLVVTDGPVYTLGDAGPVTRGGQYLLDRIQDRADPLSFVGIVAGNTDTNEVLAPGGRFGELHLVAGASDGEVNGFARDGGGGLVRRQELEPAWAGALETEGLGPDRFEGVSGFWMLEIDGGDVVLDFHMERGGRWDVVYRFVRDKQGWHLP
ncbi:MAG: hypothetical protein H6737_25535 [Alphaproteobacteria bacterium]|nr:hypothetical protein [Alphaproteobacteria bacterium]